MKELSDKRRSDAIEYAKRSGVENPSWHGARAAKIIDLTMEGGLGIIQAVDNISAFTHPSNFQARMAILRAGIQREYASATCDAEKRRIMEMLLPTGLALKDSFDLSLNLKNAQRHGDAALSDEVISAEVEKTLDLLDEFENQDKAIAQSLLQSDKERLEMIMAPRRGKGVSLFSAKAMEFDGSSLREWVDYWASFGKNCNLRKLRETTGIEGVDYGVGVRYARYLWGANLVMMNPSLAIFALEDDIELNRRIDNMVFAYGDMLTSEQLVREGTCIAGTKARDSLRAVWLLTEKGRISFQVQPSTYATKDSLAADVKALTSQFNAEALQYDDGLFLDEVMTEEEIKARKGKTHVFFKVDGSRADTYGTVEELTLKQLDKGKFSLTEGDTGGLIEELLSGWDDPKTGEKAAANCNITVNGFVPDLVPGALCQFRGHAKARQNEIPISHSIITRMGGRVEGLGMRWLAMQAVVEGLRKKDDSERASDIESRIGSKKDFDHTQNGALDIPELREAAKVAGLVLAEEVKPEEYEKYKGQLFPTDDAIRITAEAITKRSYEILEALKKCDAIESQGVEEYETLLLQASMRGPYKERYPHVVEIVAPVGSVVQGHFPNAAKDVEEFEGFVADPEAIKRLADPVLMSQLYNSVLCDEWAKAYEVNENQVKILEKLGVYDENWGNRGMNIEEFAAHPFPQFTLFGKVFPKDKIPKTKEENAEISAGNFVGDFNALGQNILERNERESYKRKQLGLLGDALVDTWEAERKITAQSVATKVEGTLSSLEGDESARYMFDFDSLVLCSLRSPTTSSCCESAKQSLRSRTPRRSLDAVLTVNGIQRPSAYRGEEAYILATNTQREIDPETYQATAFSPVKQIIAFYLPDRQPEGRQNLSEEESAVIETPKGRKIGIQVGRFNLENARIFTEKILPECGVSVPEAVSRELANLVAKNGTA